MPKTAKLKFVDRKILKNAEFFKLGKLGNLAILEKMTFFSQKILFFKIESCLSLVDRFRIELFDTIFKIRKKNESTLLLVAAVSSIQSVNSTTNSPDTTQQQRTVHTPNPIQIRPSYSTYVYYFTTYTIWCNSLLSAYL